MALESGYHVTLMAPTEVLAEQHFGTFTNWLAPLGIAVELQTGSRKSGHGTSRSNHEHAEALAVTTCALAPEAWRKHESAPQRAHATAAIERKVRSES